MWAESYHSLRSQITASSPPSSHVPNLCLVLMLLWRLRFPFVELLQLRCSRRVFLMRIHIFEGAGVFIMANIFPFQALRYDPSKVSPADVVTQPYDKITPAMQEHYYAASPYNLVRVILGKAQAGDNEQQNVYTRAAASLRQWRARRRSAARPATQHLSLHPDFQGSRRPFRRDRRAARLHRSGPGRGLRPQGGLPSRADAQQAEGRSA